MSEVTVTTANFEEEVLRSQLPVLVDFWASWCGPCSMIAPYLKAIAEDYAGRIKVGKVNVDEEQELAARHNVVSIPTLIVYKNGAILKQQSGALPKEMIENLFKDAL
jgi:thioredoxin 1